MPNHKRSHQQFFIVLCIFLSFTGILFGLDNLLTSKTSSKNLISTASANEITPTVEPTSVPSPAPTNASKLSEIVTNELTDSSGKYAVVIKNLKTGEHYSSNGDAVFTAASLYKLWVMAKTYDFIEDGTLNETDTLGATVPALNQEFGLATNSAERTGGDVNMTVFQALTLMITRSDNYAAYLLADRLKLSTIESFLRANGIVNSHLGLTGGLPTTTASDVELFYQKLYYGQLDNNESTNRMLNLLKQQQRNTKLPKYLPDSVEIAHKTGELGQVSHDAGIVYTPQGDYIIVVMTETNNPGVAVEKIAQISKAVYTYFTQN